ncbi:fumarylacetoacetate hydrolase family protein [Streptomyces sp. NPDC050355]|uniref:fumarylacetoacetate hydrolase family protein n=1 Tax=Streptomyces sp. NPDC050355 TaxID=3365609 RepID=UPI003797CDB8
MRFVTYASADGARAGVVNGDLIHALPKGTTLLELLGRSLRQAGERALAAPDEVVPVADVTLKAPIPRPPSLRDCLCFLDHMRGCLRAAGGTGTLDPTWYRIPAFYFANPATVLGPYDDVPISPGSAWFDFELEIGTVIGVAGRDLTPEQAEGHIAGYTLFCDWSAPCCLLEHLDLGDLAAFRGWLKDGDVVSLRAEGLGEVRQTVRAGAAPHPLAARPDPTARPRRPRVNPARSALPYTKGLHQVGDGVWECRAIDTADGSIPDSARRKPLRKSKETS